MPSLEERRRHHRVRIDGRAIGRATVFTDFKVVALSERGACLEMATPLAQDSECDITLNLAHTSLDVKGRVVHVESADEGAYHVGIDFVRMDAQDLTLLEAFLQRESRRGEA
jgi:PilZ domain-containing protein